MPVESERDLDNDCAVPPKACVAPTFVERMTAKVVQALPEGEEWSYEVKFDGYRALLITDRDRVQIRSRKDNDLTRTYPTVATAASRLRAESAVVDGEIVAVDSNGRPSFQALQHRRPSGIHRRVLCLRLDHLRHLAFLGLRDDKAPRQVGREP